MPVMPEVTITMERETAETVVEVLKGVDVWLSRQITVALDERRTVDQRQREMNEAVLVALVDIERALA